MCTLGVAHVARWGLHMCIFGVVHVACVGLGLVVFVVGWLLVPFILCTNCVTGPHECNPVGMGGGVV